MKTNLLKLLKKPDRALKMLGDICRQKSPEILTAMAVTGVVITVIAAVKGTTKAKELMDDISKEPETEEEKKEIAVEKVKIYVKCYAPTAIFGGLTVASIIGAHTVSSRRAAALASLYSVSEATLKEYQSAMTDEQKKEVEDKADNRKVKNTPLDYDNMERIGHGNDLCFDLWSGRYFYGSMVEIREAVAEFNQQLLYDNSMCINELYELIGLSSCELGYMVGWKVGDIVRAVFDSRLASDGTPVITVTFKSPPSITFQDW